MSTGETDPQRLVTDLRRQITELEQHRDAVVGMAEPVCYVGADGAIGFVNPAFCRRFGWTADRLLGAQLPALIAADERDGLALAMGRLTTASPELTYICGVLMADGTIRRQRWALRARFDARGAPADYQLVGGGYAHEPGQSARPIDSERLYRAFAENYPYGLLSFYDHDLRYIAMHGYGLAQIGMTSADFEGKRLRDVFPPEIYLRDEPALLAALRGETVESVVPFGDQFFRVTTLPIHDDHGAIICGMVISENVTALKQAEVELQAALDQLQLDVAQIRRHEDALRESEERYRLLAETSGDIIILHDLGGRVIYLNRAGVAATGLDARGAAARQIADLIAPDYLGAYSAYLAQRAAGDTGSYRYEMALRAASGAHIPVEAIATPVLRAGQIAEILVVARDISERKQAEARQFQLAQQFHQAQKLESIGRLAGGVAHDFNNMLTVIMGHAEIALLQLGVDDPLYSELTEIYRAAEHSSRLTRQLLAFARKQTVAPRVLDLNATIEGMLKMLRRLIGEHITLSWRPRAGVWPVRIDPSQVDQILANLCVNARDSIDGAGDIQIETDLSGHIEPPAGAEAQPPPGEFVILRVRDSGCGMDAATLAHIFEPFFTTKSAETGTGLGLATVYGIVRQNGGFIEVTSQPGRGTTFDIYLPRCDEPVSPTGLEIAGSPAMRGHETILLVEDEPTILALGQVMLARLGYHVLCAMTPTEALRIAETNGYAIHLLLTDLVMPEMNGRALAERMRAHAPRLRCLFMSGYAAETIAPESFRQEDVAFMQKPFSLESLAMRVREVLDRRGE